MFTAFFYYDEFGTLTDAKYRHFPTHVVDAFRKTQSVHVVQCIGIYM
jgi:hypothetical protein